MAIFNMHFLISIVSLGGAEIKCHVNVRILKMR